MWNYAPLALAGLLFVWVIGQTFITGQLALSQAGYDKVQIPRVLESRYRITDPAGNGVGELSCSLTPQGADIRLDCAGDAGAYDAPAGSGTIKYGRSTINWSATWSTESMGLLDFSYERTYAEAGSSLHASLRDGRLLVGNSSGTQEIAVAPGDLVEYEWAWRVNALKPQVIRSIQAPFAHLMYWDEQSAKWQPALINEILHLTTSELLDLPAGHFQTHAASVGGQSAWYASEHAGPVRFDDGMLIYELEK